MAGFSVYYYHRLHVFARSVLWSFTHGHMSLSVFSKNAMHMPFDRVHDYSGLYVLQGAEVCRVSSQCEANVCFGK